MRIVLASLLLVGCVATDDTTDIGDGGGTTGTGTGSGSNTTQPPPPPAPVASGAYQVRSSIDLTVEALLPETAANAVSTLRDFEANPAQTLFDLAESAGVPAVGTIRDELPDYVEDKLEGWINAEIAKLAINGTPVTQVAGSIVGLAETALTQFAIDSELVVGGGSATHTIKVLDFTPAGLDARISLVELPGDITTATASCTSKAATLSIGDHGYSIAYGEYAWRAFEVMFQAEFGLGVTDTIQAAVNCPALAEVISNKCYWDYCVGHKTELTAICVRGVNEAVDRAYYKFAEMRLDALHFAAGTATLVDADADLDAEALASGVWTAEINAGMGLRNAPATFTAAK